MSLTSFRFIRYNKNTPPLLLQINILYYFIVLDVPYHFQPLPLFFFLHVLTNRHRLGVYFRVLWFSYSSMFQRDIFYPRLSSFLFCCKQAHITYRLIINNNSLETTHRALFEDTNFSFMTVIDSTIGQSRRQVSESRAPFSVMSFIFLITRCSLTQHCMISHSSFQCDDS